MAKMYKVFVSYVYTDELGNSGFGSCVINSDIYPLTTSKLDEFRIAIKEENNFAQAVIVNFIKLAD